MLWGVPKCEVWVMFCKRCEVKGVSQPSECSRRCSPFLCRGSRASCSALAEAAHPAKLSWQWTVEIKTDLKQWVSISRATPHSYSQGWESFLGTPGQKQAWLWAVESLAPSFHNHSNPDSCFLAWDQAYFYGLWNTLCMGRNKNLLGIAFVSSC